MEIFAASYILPISSPPIEGGGILVQDNRIIAVASLRDLRRISNAPITNFPGTVLMPGLVNAHTHLELTHYPNWLRASNLAAPSVTYSDWIKEIITVKQTITLRDLENSIQQGLSLSLSSGTTMVGDILSDRRLLPIYNRSKLSGRIYLEFIGRDPKRYRVNVESLERDISCISNNYQAGISPHTPFTLSEELFSIIYLKSKQLNLPKMIHLAESSDETDFFLTSSGAIADSIFPFVGWEDYLPLPMSTTSTRWLSEKEWLAPDVSAVHAVNINDGDISLLKQFGTKVVICARSNHSLNVGLPPLKRLLEADIPIAIGTDSLATVSSLSIFDELIFLMDSFPDLVTPEILLRMATLGGAQAINREDVAGTLEVGKNADFLVIKTANKLNCTNIEESVISSRDIEAVYVGGEIVL